ncbi:MAG: hypothetical protein Q9219_004111 [cf. Caloplaca sp. 3 TL-2023]
MESEKFAPPPHPPPLLNEEQVIQIAQQGFLRLDLPPALRSSTEELFYLSSRFFNQPTITKEAQYPSAEGTELGYYHIPGEKEYLTYRHHTSPTSLLSQASSRFWSLAASFLHRILRDLSLALDIPVPAWDPLLNGNLSMPLSQSETTPTLLRLFNYSPASGVAERHTDTGLLTLCIGTAPGLQVWSPTSPSSPPQEGDWLDVSTQPTVLVGKTLQWLSASRLKAGVHRVVASPEGRQSIVFALRPSLRTRYFDLSAFGESRVVDLVGVWQQIRGSVFNVNAQTGIREGQKERMRARGLLEKEEGVEKEGGIDSHGGEAKEAEERNGHGNG